MYSSHWSPRLVTILGVPSSTGRMSTQNCWGAAVMIWDESQKRKLIIHTSLKHVRSRTYRSWNPWNLLTFQNRQLSKFPLLITTRLLRLQGQCWLTKWKWYEKKSKTQVALLLEFQLLWKLVFPNLSFLQLSSILSPRWNNKQNIFLSITLVKTSIIKMWMSGTSLVVQWLRLCNPRPQFDPWLGN